jgi:hypothetical protein
MASLELIGRSGPFLAGQVVCHATSSLGVSIVPLDHVSSSIIDHCPVSSEAGGHQPDDRQECPDRSHDHQNDSNGVDVESMLVWIHGDCEIQNGTDCKSDDACYQSSNHGQPLARIKVPLLRYVCPVYRHSGSHTGADTQVLGFCLLSDEPDGGRSPY